MASDPGMAPVKSLPVPPRASQPRPHLFCPFLQKILETLTLFGNVEFWQLGSLWIIYRVCLYLCIWVCVYVSLCVCLCLCWCVCLYVYEYMFVCLCWGVCLCGSVSLSVSQSCEVYLAHLVSLLFKPLWPVTSVNKYLPKIRDWWLTPVILATKEAEIRRIQFEASPDKYFTRPYLEKHLTHKRTGRVTQVVEHLPSKPEALNSKPNTTKTKACFYTHTKTWL
jgi:hypothetical protein